MPTFDHAFDWVRRNVDDGPLPTAVLGIATRGRHRRARRVRRGIRDDHYPLFSVTKPIVGLAALRLVEQGRLLPTTPLARAVPEFGAGRDDEVQLRHLVSHTSGIVEPPLDTPDGLRPSLLAPERDFAAGTMSRYSSIAFEGVAALIEHASGAPWERVRPRRRRVRRGHGTHLRRGRRPARGRRRGRAGTRLRAVRSSCGIRAPDSSDERRTCWRSAPRCSATTPRSSPRWAPSRCCARSPPAFRSSSRTSRAGGQDWGFTWNVRHSAPGLLARDTYGHGGWAGSEFWVTPSRGVCFVLLTNIGGGFGRFGVDADQLHNAIAAAAA